MAAAEEEEEGEDDGVWDLDIITGVQPQSAPNPEVLERLANRLAPDQAMLGPDQATVERVERRALPRGNGGGFSPLEGNWSLLWRGGARRHFLKFCLARGW
jgi:hypothetical protein